MSVYQRVVMDYPVDMRRDILLATLEVHAGLQELSAVVGTVQHIYVSDLCGLVNADFCDAF